MTYSLERITEFKYYGYVLASAAFFTVVNQLFKFVSPWNGTVPRKTQWKLRNIATSMSHSFMTGIWSLASLFLIDVRLVEDMVENGTSFSYRLVAVSIGYFAYDFFDMGINRLNRKSLELMGHHAVVIVCFGIALFMRKFVGFPVVSLLVEVNSFFLHWRQLLRIMGVPKNRQLYTVVKLANVCTFIVFRLGIFVSLSYFQLVYWDRIPSVISAMVSVGFVVTIIMNVVLLYRLVLSDFCTVEQSCTVLRQSD